MRMIGLFFLLFVLIIGMSIIATWTEKNNGMPNILSKYLPEDPEEAIALEAAKTGEAPWQEAEEQAQPLQIDPDVEYDPLGGSVNVTETLDIPHRHEGAVSKWITEKVGDALSFGLNNYEEHRSKISGYMSVNGLNEFNGFLTEAGVLGMMQTGGYDLRTSVLDVPELKTSGVAGGRYRWVYDMQVMLTFLPGDLNSYATPDAEYKTESLVFRIQIARVEEGQGDEGMVIETWQALKRIKEE